MPKEILPSTGSLHKEMRRGSGQPWWRYHSRQILVSPAPKLLSLNSPLWRLQAAGMVKAMKLTRSLLVGFYGAAVYLRRVFVGNLG